LFGVLTPSTTLEQTINVIFAKTEVWKREIELKDRCANLCVMLSLT